jgi:hypothetical protein
MISGRRIYPTHQIRSVQHINMEEYQDNEGVLILFVAGCIIVIMAIIVALMPVAGINYQQ